jgi:hypothetical protein
MKVDVVEVIENEDGTSEVVFDYDDEYLEFMKKELGKDELSDEEINQFLANALMQGIALMQEQEETESE